MNFEKKGKNNNGFAQIEHHRHHDDDQNRNASGCHAAGGAPSATLPTWRLQQQRIYSTTQRPVMIGGIGPDQVDKIVADLTGVQQMLTGGSSHDQQSLRSAHADHHRSAQRGDRIDPERELSNGHPDIGNRSRTICRACDQRYPPGHYRYRPRRCRGAGAVQPDAAPGLNRLACPVPRQCGANGLCYPVDPGQ